MFTYPDKIQFGCLFCGVVDVEIEIEEELYVWHECPECGRKTALSLLLAIDLLNESPQMEHIRYE